MELPSVFANKINKVISNNDVVYREDTNKKKRDVRELIRYFDKKGYSDRLKVKLLFENNHESIERLVLFKGDYFVNIDNKKIYLKDVVDYEVQ